MKSNFIYFLLMAGLLLVASPSCKKMKKVSNNDIAIDSVSVKAFARLLESKVNKGDDTYYASLFDMQYIREQLKSNSVVYSALDAEAGDFFFKNYIQQIGFSTFDAIENGGDFKFVRYYMKDNEHHIVVRTYYDFGLRIDDWIVHACGQDIKIKDGFLYNQSSTLINDLMYYIQYNIMQRSVPDGATYFLFKAQSLLEGGKEKEALKILKEQKESLKGYPQYWQLYVKTLYESDHKQFLNAFEQLSEEALFDERNILLNKMLYFANESNIEETQAVIEALIPFTGDDPIYLFFFAKVFADNQEYEAALECFNALEGMTPLLWDIWCEKLDCHYQLNDTESFKKTALLAEKIYNMTPSELLEFIELNFPAMKKVNFFDKNLKND